ncbi:biotin synthase BioB [Thermosporothrix hazakensis]|nr:biotin synthase BioB [Thermosporothrix hazakensis]
MMRDFDILAQKVLQGGQLTREEGRDVLHCPDTQILRLLSATYRVRSHFCGRRVHLHMLINAKSGLCPEDCHYCSQSRVSTAEIERYPMVTMQRILEKAHEAKKARCRRYCIVISTRGATRREINFVAEVVRKIRQEVGIACCCSMGLIDEEKARILSEAGVEQYNHNLNTSENYYPSICTTHTYQDRLNTLHAARNAGLQLCSGAIFGQGESEEDILDIAEALRELQPQSIPVNFLFAIKGTPFEHIKRTLTPYDCLRILCLIRLYNPQQEVRLSAARESYLRTLQPLALYAANSVFVSGYLTEPGQNYRETWQMIEDMGFEIEEHAEQACVTAV